MSAELSYALDRFIGRNLTKHLQSRQLPQLVQKTPKKRAPHRRSCAVRRLRRLRLPVLLRRRSVPARAEGGKR